MKSVVRYGAVCAVLAICIAATSTPTPRPSPHPSAHRAARPTPKPKPTRSPTPTPSPTPLSPDAILAQATSYDGQNLTVSGTAKNVQSRSTRQGTFVSYDLCSTQCIHVVDRTGNTVDTGATVTATGTFHAHLDRGNNSGGWGNNGGGSWGNPTGAGS